MNERLREYLRAKAFLLALILDGQWAGRDILGEVYLADAQLDFIAARAEAMR